MYIICGTICPKTVFLGRRLPLIVLPYELNWEPMFIGITSTLFPEIIIGHVLFIDIVPEMYHQERYTAHGQAGLQTKSRLQVHLMLKPAKDTNIV